MEIFDHKWLFQRNNQHFFTEIPTPRRFESGKF